MVGSSSRERSSLSVRTVRAVMYESESGVSHSIHSEPHAGGQVIVVAGEADAAAAPAIDDAVRAAFLQASAQDSERTIIIDLSEASFVDSRTIGVLVGWIEQLESRGWRMPVVCSDPNMLRVFGMIGLQGTFDFFDSREAAAAPADA